MAATAISPTNLSFNTFSAFPTLSAVHASDGALIPVGAAQKCLLVFENSDSSAAKTVTIKKGNAIQGVNDISQSIAAGATYAISVETGRFKNVEGENKGKILVTGTDANIKVACVILP